MSTFEQLQQQQATQFAEAAWAAANGRRQWTDLDEVVGHLSRQTKIPSADLLAAAATPGSRAARIGQGSRATYQLLAPDADVPEGAEVVNLAEQLGQGMRLRALARAGFTAREGFSRDLPPETPIAAQRLDVVKARELIAAAQAEVAQAVPAVLAAEIAKAGGDEKVQKIAAEAVTAGNLEQLDMLLTKRTVLPHPSGRGSIVHVETKPFDPTTGWVRPAQEVPGVSFSTARQLVAKARLFAEAKVFGYSIPVRDDAVGIEG